MALPVETHYEKDGQQVELKKPKVVLNPRTMTENERHTLIMMSGIHEDPPKGRRTWPKYYCTVLYDNRECSMEIGQSDKRAFDHAGVTMGDTIQVHMWKKAKSVAKEGEPVEFWYNLKVTMVEKGGHNSFTTASNLASADGMDIKQEPVNDEVITAEELDDMKAFFTEYSDNLLDSALPVPKSPAQFIGLYLYKKKGDHYLIETMTNLYKELTKQ